MKNKAYNKKLVLTSKISPLHWIALCYSVSGTKDPGLNSTGPESASTSFCYLLPSSGSLDTRSTKSHKCEHTTYSEIYSITIKSKSRILPVLTSYFNNDLRNVIFFTWNKHVFH